MQDNKQLVLRWFATGFTSDIANKGHDSEDQNMVIEKAIRSVAEELFTTDFSLNFSGGRRDREFIIKLNAELSTAFPDTVFNVDKIISEGDMVAFFGRSRGTHLGTYQGIPATGKIIENHYMAMVRIADGKIAQEWIFFDPSEFKQQFGVVIPPK